jgi:exodeoxyribonuclease VII small subunit
MGTDQGAMMTNVTSEVVSFEQALARLEAIVRELESSETGLDKSLERYEDGVKLLKHCRAILDEAERKIRLLTRLDSNGSPVTEAFDVSVAVASDGAQSEPVASIKRTTASVSRRLAEPADRGERLF